MHKSAITRQGPSGRYLFTDEWLVPQKEAEARRESLRISSSKLGALGRGPPTVTTGKIWTSLKGKWYPPPVWPTNNIHIKVEKDMLFMLCRSCITGHAMPFRSIMALDEWRAHESSDGEGSHEYLVVRSQDICWRYAPTAWTEQYPNLYPVSSQPSVVESMKDDGTNETENSVK
jgi:hypothetical protein